MLYNKLNLQIVCKKWGSFYCVIPTLRFGMEGDMNIVYKMGTGEIIEKNQDLLHMSFI